tara:strand:+ start:734 stop:856 length:123 start_codon:yes stop_codon:yes gene_type:complete
MTKKDDITFWEEMALAESSNEERIRGTAEDVKFLENQEKE